MNGGGWTRSASSAEASSIVESTQAKRQELKHDTFASLVPPSRPAGYESSRYLDSLAVSAPFRRDGMSLPALRDDDSESRKSFSAALLFSAFTWEEHRANVLFLVEDAK